jgi:hypothetical protein
MGADGEVLNVVPFVSARPLQHGGTRTGEMGGRPGRRWSERGVTPRGEVMTARTVSFLSL